MRGPRRAGRTSTRTRPGTGSSPGRSSARPACPADRVSSRRAWRRTAPRLRQHLRRRGPGGPGGQQRRGPAPTTIGVHHIQGFRHETCDRKVSTVAAAVAGTRGGSSPATPRPAPLPAAAIRSRTPSRARTPSAAPAPPRSTTAAAARACGLHAPASRSVRHRFLMHTAQPQATRTARARAGPAATDPSAQVRGQERHVDPGRGVVDARRVGLVGHRVDGGRPVRRAAAAKEHDGGRGRPGHEAGQPPRLYGRYAPGPGTRAAPAAARPPRPRPARRPGWAARPDSARTAYSSEPHGHRVFRMTPADRDVPQRGRAPPRPAGTAWAGSLPGARRARRRRTALLRREASPAARRPATRSGERPGDPRGWGSPAASSTAATGTRITAAPGKVTRLVGGVYRPARSRCSSRWAATSVAHRSSGTAQECWP